MTSFRTAKYAENTDSLDDPNPTDAQLSYPNLFLYNNTVAPRALPFSSTVTIDASRGNHFSLTLTSNCTIANPTGLVNGTVLNLLVKQSTGGSNTLTFGSLFKWSGGTVPAMTATANAIDLYVFQYWQAYNILACIQHPNIS